MKKWIIFILMGFSLINLTANAQTSEKYRPVQVSLVPPLSTNGWDAVEYANGFSLNMVAGISRAERGFAFAGVTNIIRDEAKGGQLAGVANVAGGDGNGFMLAGVLNRAVLYHGFQLAGVTNISSDMKGIQLGGVGNVAGRISGIQVAGVFNKATHVQGTQIGIINIADHNDYPIGLINIIKDGEMSISVTYNETGENLYSFRSGGKYLYGIMGVGFNHNIKGNKFIIEAGLGAHIPIAEYFRIDQELKTTKTYKDDIYHHSYSILPAFRLGSRLELFGGPSLNFSHTNDAGKKEAFPGHSLWKNQDSHGFRQLYMGYTVGIRYIF